VGAAGGVKLQAGVAVPSTAPEPEFTVLARAAIAASLRNSAGHCGTSGKIRALEAHVQYDLLLLGVSGTLEL